MSGTRAEQFQHAAEGEVRRAVRREIGAPPGKHSSSATAAPPSVASAAIWLVSNSSQSQMSSRYIQ